MKPETRRNFRAELHIVGINPFVFVPQDALEAIFERAAKSNGPIPIRGRVNGQPFTQTLVRFRGAWRLYVNTTMLPASPKRIGESLDLFVEFDPSDRRVAPHPDLVAALDDDDEAQHVFDSLTASSREEIVRYISRLKTDESIRRNVRRAIDFLHGKGRFLGRDAPTRER